MNKNETLIVSGASGTVGTAVAENLCDKGYNVIGLERDISGIDCYTEEVEIDLLKQGSIKKLKEILEEYDADAFLHLAWNIPEENFDTHQAWEPNIDMFENVVEAARRADVPIFINGSSIHAGTGSIPAYTVDGNLERTPEPYRSSIDPESDFDLRKEKPEKLLSPLEEDPDSPYGWSKVITERATKEAVEKGHFEIGISIRIGGVNQDDKPQMDGEPFFYSLYWSHGDLGKTIENILTADLNQKKGYHQFYGVSDNKGRIFSIENSFTGEK